MSAYRGLALQPEIGLAMPGLPIPKRRKRRSIVWHIGAAQTR